MNDTDDWQKLARCSSPGVDLDWFFPSRGPSASQGKKICAGCVVRSECLEYALWSGEKFGIWGGTNEADRRKMRRERMKQGIPTGGRESYRNWDFFAELIYK